VILGTQPSFSYTNYDGILETVSLEQFPDPDRETIGSSLRLTKIECFAKDGFI